MNRERAMALQQRQRLLLVSSAELRLRMRAQAAGLQRPLALADRVRDGWRWLQAHPELPLAAIAVVALLRPRRAWRWGVRAWFGWRTVQRLRRRWAAIV